MNNYRLSQDELECLLHGLAADVQQVTGDLRSPPADVPDPTMEPSIESATPPPPADRAVFSGHRPCTVRDDRPLASAALDAEQLRCLQTIHEVFAGLLAKSLSEKLRTRVDVRVTNIQQASFGQFVFGLDNPTCFLILNLSPLPDKHFVEIHPTVLFPMIDRLLGGGKHAGPIVRRPLTDIEQRLVRRLTTVMFDQLRKAWLDIAVIRASIDHIESNPKLAQCAVPAELMHVFEFEVELPVGRGPLRLALPDASLAVVHDQLAGRSEQPLRAESDAVSSTAADGEDADVRVIIAELPTSPEEIENLAVGDVLDIGIDVSRLAEVRVDNTVVYSGRIGNHQGRKAIRLEGEVKAPELDDARLVRRAS